MNRIVVLLVGPPGSGKTTEAAKSGLEVYDRDEARWSSIREFTFAVERIGRDRSARAVVLATAPTAQLRQQVATLISATHVYLMPPLPRDELARRIRVRGRHDQQQTLAALDRWITTHDRNDGVATFPGWPAVTAEQLDLGITS